MAFLYIFTPSVFESASPLLSNPYVKEIHSNSLLFVLDEGIPQNSVLRSCSSFGSMTYFKPFLLWLNASFLSIFFLFMPLELDWLTLLIAHLTEWNSCCGFPFLLLRPPLCSEKHLRSIKSYIFMVPKTLHLNFGDQYIPVFTDESEGMR